VERTKIAVFVDVENLTQWIKYGGPEELLSELSSIGQIIVRRAYGNWGNQHLQSFQGELNRQGFELIHNFHPVSGKNSSDIQLTIDVIEHALRLTDVEWFVLATGDSDFSPLFRRLREMGKEVIGTGPRSPLSESVKTSCSKFIYTDKVEPVSKEILYSSLDDAVDLAEKALKTFDSPVLCSVLKQSMTNMDSAFDEKTLGFKSFTDFLKTIDFINLSFDSKQRIESVSLIQKNDLTIPKNHSVEEKNTSTEDLYRGFLRKMNWRSISKKMIVEIYKNLINIKPLTRSDMVETVMQKSNGAMSAVNIKKALSIFMKASLFELHEQSMKEGQEKKWKIKQKDDIFPDIDKAILIRLLHSIEKNEEQIYWSVLLNVLYGTYSEKELKKLITEVNKEREKMNTEVKEA